MLALLEAAAEFFAASAENLNDEDVVTLAIVRPNNATAHPRW